MHAMVALRMDRDGVTMKEALETVPASTGEMDLPIFILKKFTPWKPEFIDAESILKLHPPEIPFST